MITTSTSGVWELNEVYSKRNAERWRPDGVGLFVWGRNENGQLGQSNRTYYSSPVQIPGNLWINFSGGGSHSIVRKSDGTLWAFGFNNSGQLGQNNRIYYSSPVQIPGTQWSSISCGNQHSLATKSIVK